MRIIPNVLNVIKDIGCGQGLSIDQNYNYSQQKKQQGLMPGNVLD
jgi:hypothetical protein